MLDTVPINAPRRPHHHQLRHWKRGMAARLLFAGLDGFHELRLGHSRQPPPTRCGSRLHVPGRAGELLKEMKKSERARPGRWVAA